VNTGDISSFRATQGDYKKKRGQRSPSVLGEPGLFPGKQRAHNLGPNWNRNGLVGVAGGGTTKSDQKADDDSR